MVEGSQAFEEIQELLHLANLALEPNLLRSKIIELLFNKIYVERSVFYLPGDSTGGIEVNLEEKYVRQYKEYFHRYDPIQLINDTYYMRRVIRLEEVIDYHTFVSSKFYCDFLKPQKIHHKLYINLYTGDRYHGRIALFRPPHSEGFSDENVRTLRAMAPFLAFALDHNDLLIKTRVQEGAFNLVDRNVAVGVILVDDSMHPVYMNQKARAFCRELRGCGHSKVDPGLPSGLLDDCRDLSEELGSRADCPALPRYRVLRRDHFRTFHISSRPLGNGSSFDGKLYMISIEEVHEGAGFETARLQEIYKLTKREIDIVIQTYRGLKNAEIARRLFISEITVKKHIQNIFQKMGVKSRTALVHRILEDDPDFFSTTPSCGNQG
ncbi:MAG: LuxR family transcriptional regulator [Desulfobacteraceae bacterium]|nr:MAG: LuxR family transcriptional regulator [Desulfobacteraceae bacterium]